MNDEEMYRIRPCMYQGNGGSIWGTRSDENRQEMAIGQQHGRCAWLIQGLKVGPGTPRCHKPVSMAQAVEVALISLKLLRRHK